MLQVLQADISKKKLKDERPCLTRIPNTKKNIDNSKHQGCYYTYEFMPCQGLKNRMLFNDGLHPSLVDLRIQGLGFICE